MLERQELPGNDCGHRDMRRALGHSRIHVPIRCVAVALPLLSGSLLGYGQQPQGLSGSQRRALEAPAVGTKPLSRKQGSPVMELPQCPSAKAPPSTSDCGGSL
jgi:hypothetical protein